MTVKELLDKQYEYTPIIVSEEYDCRACKYARKSHYYLKDILYRDMIYDECGDREVEWFNFFFNPDNRIVMSIHLIKNN